MKIKVIKTVQEEVEVTLHEHIKNKISNYESAKGIVFDTIHFDDKIFLELTLNKQDYKLVLKKEDLKLQIKERYIVDFDDVQKLEYHLSVIEGVYKLWKS